MGKIAKSPSDMGAGINWENYIILLQADKYRLTGKSILTNMVIGYVKFTHCFGSMYFSNIFDSVFI